MLCPSCRWLRSKSLCNGGYGPLFHTCPSTQLECFCVKYTTDLLILSGTRVVLRPCLSVCLLHLTCRSTRFCPQCVCKLCLCTYTRTTHAHTHARHHRTMHFLRHFHIHFHSWQANLSDTKTRIQIRYAMISYIRIVVYGTILVRFLVLMDEAGSVSRQLGTGTFDSVWTSLVWRVFGTPLTNFSPR